MCCSFVVVEFVACLYAIVQADMPACSHLIFLHIQLYHTDR